ncbi:GNAT family N-acetyltransferase [Nocardioides sp. GXQ0305]|uniref:GNAT family N-acetyltransferase n=1 Tax=Nocardioides sp. GXQ0305 TaxID=3423912 RepID=UPI003D7D4DFF
MGLHGSILTVGDVDAALGSHWEQLPASRGLQADLYDSYAWHAAAWRAEPGLARATRIPAVLDDAGRPVALLPVTRRPSGAWRSLGVDIRPRSRVVTRGEQPDPEGLVALAEALARGGARALALHRLPSRDPATGSLLDALRRTGYVVTSRERSTDRLAHPAGDWDAHRQEYRSFAKYADRFSRRVSKTWDLTMDTYGTTPELDAATGFDLYADLQARSWKGPFDPTTRRRRAELVRLAELQGTVRIFILRIAGVPVAGHVWFRTGPVATWMSTAHDGSFDALSPGTIAQWWAQERLFAEEPPALLDYLPGGSPQKDRLSPDRPALLEVDAVRSSPVAGVALPVRREARRVLPAVRDRSRAQVREWRSRLPRADSRPVRVRTVRPAPGDAPTSAWSLDVEDPAVRRYLAVACGEPSPESMARGWDDADTWWGLGPEPVAFVRLGADDGVRELVRLGAGLDDGDVVRALAAAVGRPVTLQVPDRTGELRGRPARVHEPRLPWPADWTPATPGRPASDA